MTNDGTHWADRHIHGIPHGHDTTVTVTVTVNADDHPSAIITARLAPLAVDTWRHIDDLASLDKGRLYYLLNDVRKFAAAAANLEEELIVRYRAAGASWADLGNALDVHRQTARDRYHRIIAANVLVEAAVDARARDADAALLESLARRHGTEPDVIAAELQAIRERAEQQSDLAQPPTTGPKDPS